RLIGWEQQGFRSELRAWAVARREGHRVGPVSRWPSAMCRKRSNAKLLDDKSLFRPADLAANGASDTSMLPLVVTGANETPWNLAPLAKLVLHPGRARGARGTRLPIPAGRRAVCRGR